MIQSFGDIDTNRKQLRKTIPQTRKKIKVAMDFYPIFYKVPGYHGVMFFGIRIEERHLGLHIPDEVPNLMEKAKIVSSYIPDDLIQSFG